MGADLDGDTLTYAWTQISGPTATIQTPAAAVTTIVAPTGTATEVLVFRVTACDPSNACATADATVNVSVANTAPTAVATAPATVDVQVANITLDASGSTDPQGDPLTFAWTQTAGPTVALATASTNKATWTSPVVPADTVFTFQVSVCDPSAACSTATVSTTVRGIHTYVSPAGNDATGRGTQALPWRTIGKGISTATTYAYPSVFVDKGSYDENVAMANSVNVLCGYDRNATWARDFTANISTIRTTNATGVTFSGGANAMLEGCTVLRTAGVAAVGTYANITVTASTAAITRCIVDATSASAGTDSTGINVASGTANITMGSVNGGNGTAKSRGVRLSAGATATLTTVTVTTAAATGEHTAVETIGGNLIVTGGTLTGGSGGSSARGIDQTSGTTTVSAANVGGGTATASSIGISASGGANAGSLTVTGSTVVGGSAPNVDGIVANALTATITTSTVTGASAAPGGAAPQNARGIRVIGGVQVVKIQNNTAVTGGVATTTAIGIALSGATTKNPEINNNTLIRGAPTATTTTMTGISVTGGSNPNVHNNPAIIGGNNGGTSEGIAIVQAGGEYVANGLIMGNEAGAATKESYGIRLDQAGATLVNGTTNINGGRSVTLSCGLCSDNTRALTVTSNTINGGNTAPDTIGLRDQGGSLTLTVDANLIRGGSGVASTGVNLKSTPAATISNNRMFGGTGPTATGLKAEFGSSEIRNNYITGQGAATASSPSVAYGVWAMGNGPATSYYNNIIDTGRAALTRYGFFENLFWDTATSVKNNDFYPDAAGGDKLYHTTANTDLTTAAQINARFGPADNYASNLAVNPLFVSEATADYHLQAASLCVNAGLNTNASDHDMDLQTRALTNGNPADIGPDER